jgi:cold shock CspA family protein
MTGFVKRFDEHDGFGFIISMVADEPVDVFFYIGSIITEPRSQRVVYPGDEVEFDITRTDKGWKALNVNLVKRGTFYNAKDDHGP